MAISAVLIMKNEEAVIGRCLQSLRGADQIVILDTGSTDRSVEVARSLGADVFTTDLIVPFHFAEARNRALAHAKHDWCISIDADEVMRPGSMKIIRRATEMHYPAHGKEWAPRVGAMNIKFIMRSEASDQEYPIQKMKVFRKSMFEWRYRIHELLFPKKDVGTPGIIELPEAVIEHAPLPDKAARHGQNLELLRLCVKESPEYARAFRQLALELMLRKEYGEAIPSMARWMELLRASGVDDPFEISEACCHIGECHAQLGETEKALSWFEAGFTVSKSRREPLYRAAGALMAQNRPGDAIGWLKRALAIPIRSKPDFHLNMASVWRPGGSVEEMLVLAFIHSGRLDEAKEFLLDLLEDRDTAGMRFHFDADPNREATIRDVLEYCRANGAGIVT